MKVTIVTKMGCARCMLLKEKLRLMDVKWEEIDHPPPGVLVETTQLPITMIDGEPYEYAAAIKKLKEMLDEADA